LYRKGAELLPGVPADRRGLGRSTFVVAACIVRAWPVAVLEETDRMLARLVRAALNRVGIEAIRVPGPARRLLVMGRRTRRQLGLDLLLHEHLKVLFERYAVECVLDVGANTGQYGSELRHAGYRGRLLSFEPVPHLCARLREAAARDPAWTVHPVALGRSTGHAELNVTRQSVFTSFHEPLPFASHRFGEATAVARRERVPVRRLEEVLDEALGNGPPPRCFLKMDTQGYDLEVFAGLGRWAERLVGLQSEVAAIALYSGMPRMTDAIAHYEAAGFELTGLFPVSRDEPTGRVIEFDCVLFRAGALPPASPPVAG
jgi:FkbM family methyltransferase